MNNITDVHRKTILVENFLLEILGRERIAESNLNTDIVQAKLRLEYLVGALSTAIATDVFLTSLYDNYKTTAAHLKNLRNICSELEEDELFKSSKRRFST